MRRCATDSHTPVSVPQTPVWAVVRYYVHWPGNMRSAAETVAVLEAAEQAGQIRRYGVHARLAREGSRVGSMTRANLLAWRGLLTSQASATR